MRHKYFAYIFGHVLHYSRLKQAFTLVVKTKETSFPLVPVQCGMGEPTAVHCTLLTAGKPHHRQCSSADSLWLGSLVMNQGGYTVAFGLLDAQPNDGRLAKAIMYWRRKKPLETSIFIWLYSLTKCVIIFCRQCVFIHFIICLLRFFLFVFCVLSLYFLMTVTQ